MPTSNLKLRHMNWLLSGLALLFVIFWQLPALYTVPGLAKYLPLHMAAETFSIVIAMLVFGVAWNAHSPGRSGNLLILAGALLAVGLIDFAHMLSFAGMPEFITPSGPEKAINLWLSARLLAALALLVVALRPWQPFADPRSRYVTLTGGLAIAAVVVWAGLFHPQDWPRTFIAGQGLTAFKMGAEYVIVAILLVPAVQFYRQARQQSSFDAASLFAATVISILSELCFTLYSDVADIFNLLGHLYKVVAYAFLYRAVFVASVREPYQRLDAELAEKRRIMQALRESESLFRNYFELGQVGMAITSVEKGWLQVNRRLCEMLGYSKEELTSMAWPELTHPDDLAADRAQFKQLLAGKLERYSMDKRFVRKDKSLVYVYLTVACQRKPDGSVDYVIAAIQDITERKQAEAEIRQLNADLEQRVADRTAKLEVANQELEAFSYSVSHDLRTPLRAIDGFSGILLEDYNDKLDDEGRRLLHVVRDNTVRMGQLIDDILKFSRAGRLAMEYAEINMEELARSVYAELKPDAAERTVQFELEALPAATGDLAMMKQVFVNLLSNALKFTRPRAEARIKVGSAVGENETIYYVQDNGVGFDMAYVGKLFGVFQRLHGVDEFDGTGIGLAIVKRIITRHGGRVWAEGKVNAGATLYFALPSRGEKHD